MAAKKKSEEKTSKKSKSTKDQSYFLYSLFQIFVSLYPVFLFGSLSGFENSSILDDKIFHKVNK